MLPQYLCILYGDFGVLLNNIPLKCVNIKNKSWVYSILFDQCYKITTHQRVYCSKISVCEVLKLNGFWKGGDRLCNAVGGGWTDIRSERPVASSSFTLSKWSLTWIWAWKNWWVCSRINQQSYLTSWTKDWFQRQIYIYFPFFFHNGFTYNVSHCTWTNISIMLN